MRVVTWCAAVAAVSVLAGQAQATEGVVLGDSHGLGIGRASGLQNFSRISIHIRGPKILDQIRHAPSGSIGFLVLGTNDANGSIARLDKSIDDILQAADAKRMKLVWIGPPCVKVSWDNRARELDGVLRAKLAARGVRYVSIRDEEFCNGGLHSRDGVHLTTRGYAFMWEKARLAANFPAGASQTRLAAAPSATPAQAKQRIPLPRRDVRATTQRYRTAALPGERAARRAN